MNHNKENKKIFVSTKRTILKSKRIKDFSKEEKDWILFYHNHIERWIEKTPIQLNKIPVVSIPFLGTEGYNSLSFQFSMKNKFELHLEIVFNIEQYQGEKIIVFTSLFQGIKNPIYLSGEFEPIIREIEMHVQHKTQTNDKPK